MSNIQHAHIEVRAVERMLGNYLEILDGSFDGSDTYIEERMHLLNCRYAQLLWQLEDSKGTVIDGYSD